MKRFRVRLASEDEFNRFVAHVSPLVPVRTAAVPPPTAQPLPPIAESAPWSQSQRLVPDSLDPLPPAGVSRTLPLLAALNAATAPKLPVCYDPGLPARQGDPAAAELLALQQWIPLALNDPAFPALLGKVRATLRKAEVEAMEQPA